MQHSTNGSAIGSIYFTCAVNGQVNTYNFISTDCSGENTVSSYSLNQCTSSKNTVVTDGIVVGLSYSHRCVVQSPASTAAAIVPISFNSIISVGYANNVCNSIITTFSAICMDLCFKAPVNDFYGKYTCVYGAAVFEEYQSTDTKCSAATSQELNLPTTCSPLESVTSYFPAKTTYDLSYYLSGCYSLPTTAPSHVPTTAPSDIISGLLLDAPVTHKVFVAKTSFYIAGFIAYFAASYICLYIFAKSKYGKRTVNMLYQSAYDSDYYKQRSRNVIQRSESSHINVITSIYVGNKFIQDTIENANELTLHRKIELDLALASGTDSSNINYIEEVSAPKLNCNDEDTVSHSDLKWNFATSRGFQEYLNLRRYMIGCRPIIFPNGIVLKLLVTKIVLPPGYVENLIVFICNNHPFFNCFYFIESRDNFGSRGRILVYIMKESVVFVLTQFVSEFVKYYSIEHFEFADPLVKFFIISPVSVVVGIGLIYLYKMPCVDGIDNSNLKRYNLHKMLRYIGRVLLVPVVILMGGSLVMACIFSSGREIPYILLDFFANVQLFSILLEIMQAILGFYDNYYYRVTVFGKKILSIGDLFVERIVNEGLVLGSDYFVERCTYLRVINVTTILRREDAIRKGWFVNIKNETTDDNAVEMHDFKSKSSNISNSNDDRSSYQDSNKLFAFHGYDEVLEPQFVDFATNPLFSSAKNEVKFATNTHDASHASINASSERIVSSSDKEVRVIATDQPNVFKMKL